VSVTPARGAPTPFLRSIVTATSLAVMLAAPLAACSASPRQDVRALRPQPSPANSILALTNRMRSRGCNANAGAAPPLHRESRLDTAAERLASGATLEQATKAVGYRAAKSVSLEIAGDLSEATLGRMLASRFCAQLSDPALLEIGIYVQGTHLWMLAAAPFATAELADPRRVAERVLDLINRARATGRRCGGKLFGPVRPLHASAQLREAALAHSRDMAAHSDLEHIGRDGSTPGQRVAHTGYLWRAVGENIAAGPSSAQDAVDGWLASPEHCANIMTAAFSDTGIAYAVDPKSRMGVYWTEDFAAPRQRSSRRGTSSRSRHLQE